MFFYRAERRLFEMGKRLNRIQYIDLGYKTFGAKRYLLYSLNGKSSGNDRLRTLNELYPLIEGRKITHATPEAMEDLDENAKTKGHKKVLKKLEILIIDKI
jgi:hypothetical protein